MIKADESRTPGEYEAHGYKLGLGMKDNSESALSVNKEAISNATMNLMESSILAQDERWRWKRPRRLRSKRRNPPEEGIVFD
ncbi:hypothetical protein Tco_0385747 [Tanacetum coccineum]